MYIFVHDNQDMFVDKTIPTLDISEHTRPKHFETNAYAKAREYSLEVLRSDRMSDNKMSICTDGNINANVTIDENNSTHVDELIIKRNQECIYDAIAANQTQNLEEKTESFNDTLFDNIIDSQISKLPEHYCSDEVMHSPKLPEHNSSDEITNEQNSNFSRLPEQLGSDENINSQKLHKLPELRCSDEITNYPNPNSSYLADEIHSKEYTNFLSRPAPQGADETITSSFPINNVWENNNANLQPKLDGQSHTPPYTFLMPKLRKPPDELLFSPCIDRMNH
ncbi:hypothetical protein ACROYT_G017881 [Oculina patagonica]